MTVMTDPTQQQAAPPVVETPANQPPVDAPEWLKGVDADLIAEPSVKNMKNMNDLIKSFVHAQKAIGQDKVIVPSKTATKEQWAEFHKKVGLPESIEKYEVPFKAESTIEKGALDVLKKAAFENGILPHQALGLYEQLEGYSAEASKRAMEASKGQASEAIKSLQTEWGDGYKLKVSTAVEAAKKFGGDEFLAHLESTGMGNDVRLIKLLATIGENLLETPPKGMDIDTPAGYDATLNDILTDYNHPYYKADHIGHKEAVKKVEFLMQKKYK